MMADVEKLKAAREKVARPGGWTQHTFCRDADGDPTALNAQDAVSFCSFGALRTRYPNAETAWVGFAVGHPELAAWNDAPGRTQAEVVAAFDRAIALAEAAP